MLDTNEIGIALIYTANLFLVVIFIFYKNRRDQDFVRLSIFFIIAFFILPATLCARQEDFVYLGKLYRVYPGAWLLIGISVWVFILGFFTQNILTALHYRKPREGRDPSICKTSPIRLHKAILFIALAIIAKTIVWYLNPSSQEEYEIRTGALTGSHLTALLNILSGSIYFAAIFVSAHLKLRLVTAILLTGLMIFTFSGSPGRFNAAIAILLFAIYVFNLNTSKIAVSFPILLISAFPIIVGGKLLIFAITTKSSMPHFSELLESATELSTYLNNSGHPMVSLFQIERLLELSNVRWFYDFPQGLLFYLRIFGYDAGPSLTYYNTQAFFGFKSSIVPTGYLAFGYAQMSYFGIFIMGVFYRSIYHFFANLRYIRETGSPILAFYISLTTANTFYTGEVRTLILQFFLNILIFHVCFWFTSSHTLLRFHRRSL
jgi:hypothetical protein